MSLAEMQIVLAVTSAVSLLSAAWLVLHARDVVLLLRPCSRRWCRGRDAGLQASGR